MKDCILLVEDYPPNVMVASHMLEGMGYECETANCGEEALAKIRANRDKYMAVLMDVQMPDIDGYTVTQIIRQEEAEQHLPHLSIIAMTALALRGDAERCLTAGMDHYLSKPFKIDELQSKLSLAERGA